MAADVLTPPTPALVAQARAGNCLGDLPGYDAFLLGGPYSGE